jgi:hypothetical protein
MRYSAESTVLPTNAPDLLNWAAAHVEARGFHDGRDADKFGRDRGVTSTRLFTPGILGALDVAGGAGRRSSSRAYDYPALYAAQRLALDTLSDLVAGGAVMHDSDWPDEYRHRRYVVHQWGTQGDRTRDDVVEVLREAAGLAELAATAAARPGRPMARMHRGSVGGVLAWAATHLEDVGHRPGLESHDPAGFAGSSACTALHALDRAFVAAKPNPADGRETWAAYGEAESAWCLFVEHIAGGPLVAVDDMTSWELTRHLRGTVLMWGNEPGRSTADVVAAFRAAVPAESG